nr:hypothetical protein [Tanacetum cinerariifolium]
MSNNNMQTQTSNALHNAIMETGGKDRPPMLAPGNYVQWKSKIKRYIDTKSNNELIHYCLQNLPYKFKWTKKTVPVAKGSSETTTEWYMENYKNVSQDMHDQLNAEAEAVQIILTGIDNDIYSTVDACPNACEMWKAIERLKQGESINVQDLKTNLHWEFGKFTSRDVNEIRPERLAHTANPLVLVAQQQPTYHPQYNPNHQTQNSSTRSQQTTKNRGKEIVNFSTPIYDQELAMVTKDDEMSKEKKIDKLMALISLSGIGYENHRVVNVTGARETVGTQKSKRAKDAAYHKENMLLRKQEEDGVQLNAEQADWKDTDDESDDQELETHYMYMAHIQEVTPDSVDNSGPIFDVEPLQKVQNDDDNYNVFGEDQEYPKQPESVNEPYPDICYDREHDDQDDTDELDQERDLFASLIEKLKCEIDDSKNYNKSLEQGFS